MVAGGALSSWHHRHHSFCVRPTRGTWDPSALESAAAPESEVFGAHGCEDFPGSQPLLTAQPKRPEKPSQEKPFIGPNVVALRRVT